MSDKLPTVKVKSDKPKGYRIINESDFDPAKHKRFDVPSAPPPPPPGPPAPPPPPPGPLDNLPNDWRSKSDKDLKALAAAVNDGRTVENKTQAIQVIEAALKAKEAAK